TGLVPGFFFQADDGIRFRTVTRVQTCALPILPRITPCLAASSSRWSYLLPTTLTMTGLTQSFSHRPIRTTPHPIIAAACEVYARSEERRVGKECRPRW